MKHKNIFEIYDGMLDENFVGLDKWQHHLTIYDKYLVKPENLGDETFSLVNFSESVDSSILFARLLTTWELEKEVNMVHVHKHDKDVSALQMMGIKTLQGDYGDDAFLRKVVSAAGAMHVVVDDTHYTNSQRAIIKGIYPRMNHDSVLFVEDTYFNHRKDYITSKPTFLEYVQTLYRELDDWHNNSMQDKQYQLPESRRDIAAYNQVTQFGSSTEAIHLHNGMVVFEKSKRTPPWQKIRKW